MIFLFLLLAAFLLYGSWRLSPTAGIIATTLAVGVVVFGGLAVFVWWLTLKGYRKATQGLSAGQRAAERRRLRAGMNGR